MEKLELTKLGSFINRHCGVPVDIWRQLISLIIKQADQDMDWSVVAMSLRDGGQELLETDLIYEIINEIDEADTQSA